MAQFEPALATLLKHEGGFVNNPNDPGGATKYGISLRYLQKVGDLDGDGWLDGDLDKDGDVDADDIAILQPEDAGKHYLNQFWKRYRYDWIASQDVATKLLCLSVHAGPRRAHLVLQKSIIYHTAVTVDGLIGPLTRAAANMVEETWLGTEFRHETAKFYRELIQTKPKFAEFDRGWMNRAYD